MIKEIVDSLRQAFDERVGNPLLGAFIVLWCVCNVRLITVVVFGEGDLAARIDSADTGWTRTLFMPAGLAVLYLVVMPWVAFVVQKYHLWVSNMRKLDKIGTESKLYEKRIELAQLRYRLSEFEFDRSVSARALRNDLTTQLSNQHLEAMSEKMTRITELETIEQTLRKDLESFKSTQGDSEQELQDKIAKMTREIEQLNNKIKELGSSNDSRRQTLKKRDEELKQTRAELAQLKQE